MNFFRKKKVGPKQEESGSNVESQSNSKINNIPPPPPVIVESNIVHSQDTINAAPQSVHKSSFQPNVQTHCVCCTTQGPSKTNPCSCFYKNNQQAAGVAAIVSILINFIAVIIMTLLIRFEMYTFMAYEIVGEAVFLIFCTILIVASVVLKYSVENDNSRFCYPWMICQLIMIVLILILVGANIYSYSVAEPKFIVSTHNKTSSQQNASPPPPNIDKKTNPSSTFSLIMFLYLFCHLAVSVYLLAIIIMYLKSLRSLLKVESEMNVIIETSSTTTATNPKQTSTTLSESQTKKKTRKKRVEVSPAAVDPDPIIKETTLVFQIDPEGEPESEEDESDSDDEDSDSDEEEEDDSDEDE